MVLVEDETDISQKCVCIHLCIQRPASNGFSMFGDGVSAKPFGTHLIRV